MSRLSRDYRAYGLWVRSAIALPFAPVPVPPAGAPDVTVRIGPIPGTPRRLAERPGETCPWEATPGRFLLNVRGVARFLVTGGRDVRVEPRGGGDHEMGIVLASRVLGALLQQRGVITFHASAVETDAGAVLFMGSSGSGKSSLLAALVERGYAMLADNVAGVVPDAGGGVVALSAFPCAQLRADALDALGWWGRARGAMREGLERYLVAVDRFRDAPQAVGAVCVLGVHRREAVEVETAPAADAFEWLCRYTYRKEYIDGLGQRPAHFRTVVALAGRVPVLRVTRPAHRLPFGALADRIEEWLRGMHRQGASPEVARKGRPIDRGFAAKRAGRSTG